MTAPWYKCFPRDFNDGMMGLTLEERGVYITILNEIYARGAPLPEQEWVITSKLGCTRRTWVKVRAALILKGKLYAVNYNGVDCLMNERAAEEIADREKLSESCAERGARGGRKSGEKRRENNETAKQELQSAEANPKRYQKSEADTDTTTSDAREAWRKMLDEATEAAGDMADLTRPAMHHAADLKALVEPVTGEPCTWAEVLDAIRMVAMRQRAKGKPIASWKWVREDALTLRDKRLTASNPEAAPRATGPPRLEDQIAERNRQAEALAFKMLDAQNGRKN